MVEERKFNYGKLYKLMRGGNWTQGEATKFSQAHGICYCLASGLNEAYKMNTEQETYEARAKLIEAIRKLFPDRTSALRSRLARARQPMVASEYSLVGFNDNPHTTFQDVMQVIIEAQV